MAINFPNSPATNDTFVGPTGIEYIYDGVKWRSFKPTEPVIGTFNANSAISLTAGGTNQNITLTPSGTGIVTVPSNVGIGTTTPASKLQVTTTNGAAPVNTSGSNALRLRSTATAAVGVGPSILFEGQTGNTTANYGFAAIQAFKGSATAADYSGALAFYTQNSGGAVALTERMRIDSAGNLGFGVTPSAWGDFLSGGTIELRNGVSLASSLSTPLGFLGTNSYFDGVNFIRKSGSLTSQYRFGGGSHEWYTAPFGTSGSVITFTKVMMLDDNGNLGIGVTPVNDQLGASIQIKRARFSGGANDRTSVAYNYYRTSNVDTYIATDFATIYDQISGQHRWFNAPSGTAGNQITFTQAMTLDASGNLGIGVTPAYKLDVATISVAFNQSGAVRFGGNDQYGMRLSQSIDGSAVPSVQIMGPKDTTGWLAFTLGSTDQERMRIAASGNILIGGSATALTAIPGSLGNSSTYARIGMTVVNDTTTLAYFQTYNSNATTDLKTWRHGGQTDGSYVFQTVNDAYSASTTRLTLTTAGVLSDGKGDVRSAPIQTKSAAYVVVASDAGQTIYISTGGVTINASILSAGDMVTIVNNSASNQTITAGASVTFRLAGTATTGNRTLAQYGMATFLCVVGGATPTFHCSGAGLT